MSITEESPGSAATTLDDRIQDFTTQQRLDLWKAWAETVDRASQRRMLLNGFFLTVNTFMLAVFSSDQRISQVAVGVALSILWVFSLNNSLLLSKAKFKVTEKIEDPFPFRPFAEEWKEAREGNYFTKYRSASYIEMLIPVSFALLYIIISIF